MKISVSGIEIIKHRIMFVEEYEPYVKESYKRILFNKELPEIQYFYLMK